MLNGDLLFNYRSMESFTSYEMQADARTAEKEVSFSVWVGPSTERRGDVFPVYEVPERRMLWLSDWSFNTGGPLNTALSIGGSLGRITVNSEYVYVLNCSVSAGEMEIFSPAHPIRYLPGQWLAVCLHHMGEPLDIAVRATFRFKEIVCSRRRFRTRFFEWWAKDKNRPLQWPGVTKEGRRQ